jgi:hypothetical protein
VRSPYHGHRDNKACQHSEIGDGSHDLCSCVDCGGDDGRLLLQPQIRRFGIVRREPDPSGYGDPDTSDHFLIRQDESAIRLSYELPFHSDNLTPLLLGDRADSVDAPAELASLVRFTGLEEASNIQDKWDHALATLIQRNKDGTVERLAVVNLSDDDWSDAPVTAENVDTDIILV